MPMHATIKPRQKGKLRSLSFVPAAVFLLILGLLPLASSARLLPALDTSSPYATMQSFGVCLISCRRLGTLTPFWISGFSFFQILG